ncbi:hypothetical protein DVH05_004289 [Phytophthora capsici]|nr:hypothetical protein DVH05_004289 [Phytophthora capsici]
MSKNLMFHPRFFSPSPLATRDSFAQQAEGERPEKNETSPDAARTAADSSARTYPSLRARSPLGTRDSPAFPARFGGL